MNNIDNKSVKYPLSINFNTFQQYDLKVTRIESILLFEWLIVKRLSFGSDEFFYQHHRVFKELPIKRHTFEITISIFISYGLKYEKKGSNNVSHYTVNENFIKSYINAHLLPEYLKNTLKKILTLDFKNEVKVSNADKKRILKLINNLEAIYNQRREMICEHTNGKRKLSNSGLTYNGKTFQQLKLLTERYDEIAIRNSFTCYSDKLLRKQDKTYHILNNFSTYNRSKDSFPVYESRLNEFNDDYSIIQN